MVDKGNHKHFMAKEIHEQPEVVGHTLAHCIDMTTEKVVLPGNCRSIEETQTAVAVLRTAYYAGLVAKYWFERFAKLPVEIDIASDSLPRGAARKRRSRHLHFAVGRDRRQLATLRYAKQHKQHVLSAVNVPTSSIAREATWQMPTLAGPRSAWPRPRPYLPIGGAGVSGVAAGRRAANYRPPTSRNWCMR
jgi:glucosamine--fructose-6-phosphate aminotransferase (isomerizing)